MGNSKTKVRLSPKLQLGVGRGRVKQNYLKYSGFAFILISLALLGRAVFTIATHHDNAVQNVTEANPSVLGATDSANQSSNLKKYTVKKGDTIFNIAQTYHLNWATLATLNNLSSPFTLKVGQVLDIPAQ